MKDFKEKLYKKLDIEPDIVGGSMIELRGRESLSLRGCERILVYRSDEIRLSISEGVLAVLGERLICTSYFGGVVRIEGSIKGISFEEEEK